VHWWQAYDHFVRPHATLRVALIQTREGDGRQEKPRYRQRTEADGSWENQSQMDRRGGALLPAAAGPCLRADEASNGHAMALIETAL
jgi:hypothetical protein